MKNSWNNFLQGRDEISRPLLMVALLDAVGSRVLALTRGSCIGHLHIQPAQPQPSSCVPESPRLAIPEMNPKHAWRPGRAYCWWKHLRGLGTEKASLNWQELWSRIRGLRLITYGWSAANEGVG